LRSRRRLRPGSPRRLSQIPTRVFEKRLSGIFGEKS
jgi:hypothetical protein